MHWGKVYNVEDTTEIFCWLQCSKVYSCKSENENNFLFFYPGINVCTESHNHLLEFSTSVDLPGHRLETKKQIPKSTTGNHHFRFLFKLFFTVKEDLLI